MRKYIIYDAAKTFFKSYSVFMALDINSYFGQKVKEARNKNDISQLKLSELASMGLSTINRIERGEANITLRNAFKIAKALKIKLSDLIDV